jgi:serine/threonine protein phosphatase 1
LPAVPAGERVYAVGDIHGRVDLFDALIQAIEADDEARGAADTTIVLLGDLVDRGPASAAVVRAAYALSHRRKVRIICGNHEEMFLESFERTEVLQHFLRYGGRETILSYPVDADAFETATLDEAQAIMRGAVPEADLAFMRSFENFVAIGGYLFVHAGIRPHTPIAKQTSQNLRWIREPFLSYPGDHGCIVVHGHTITSEPELLHNRIGIDTGAFMSGRLTALALEGAERWLIEASDHAGTIASTSRAA